MVSTPRSIATRSSVSDARLERANIARLNARISAYLIDSVVLFGFILVCFVIAGAILLMNSDLGKQDAPDSAYYAFIAVLVGGSVLGWTVFNLAMSAWRGQSIGKYMTRIRAVDEDGRRPGPGRVLLRWFGLNPLFFHPLLLPVWATFALLATFITLSQAVLIVMLAALLLWIVSPVIALIMVLLSPTRRALHDHLAGTIVVDADEP